MNNDAVSAARSARAIDNGYDEFVIADQALYTARLAAYASDEMLRAALAEVRRLRAAAGRAERVLFQGAADPWARIDAAIDILNDLLAPTDLV